LLLDTFSQFQTIFDEFRESEHILLWLVFVLRLLLAFPIQDNHRHEKDDQPLLSGHQSHCPPPTDRPPAASKLRKSTKGTSQIHELMSGRRYKF
jgi:hypothetical protein